MGWKSSDATPCSQVLCKLKHESKWSHQERIRWNKKFNECFWRGRNSCELLQWNPLTKKILSTFLHVCLSLFSILWFPQLIASISVISARLCIFGSSYLSFGHIPSASRSGLTSSSCPLVDSLHPSLTFLVTNCQFFILCSPHIFCICILLHLPFTPSIGKLALPTLLWLTLWGEHSHLQNLGHPKGWT